MMTSFWTHAFRLDAGKFAHATQQTNHMPKNRGGSPLHQPSLVIDMLVQSSNESPTGKTQEPTTHKPPTTQAHYAGCGIH